MNVNMGHEDEQYTVRNVETKPALFRANYIPSEEMLYIVPCSKFTI